MLALQIPANVRLVQTTSLGKFVQTDPVNFSMAVDLFPVTGNLFSFAHFSFHFSSCVEVEEIA